MHRVKITTLGGSCWRILVRCGAIVLAGFLFWSHTTWAAPVTADTATSTVQGWLRQDHRPLGKQLSNKVKRTEAVKNAAGDVLYYVVHLDPAGFVVLPADDAVDPVVAFSATGSFDAASQSPLAVMVNKDLPRRMARARAGALKSHRGKWNAMLAGSPNPPPDMEQNNSITVASQIWVAPFVQTLWNQSTDVSLNDAVYNYYTPPGAAGDPNNDVCGCVATCMAQVMYYFQYPNTGVGTNSNITLNEGPPISVRLLGGNGNGGPYQWNNMPLSPNFPTPSQAMAIGALTSDAGVAVNMDYSPDDSSAYTYLAQEALTNTFEFANASYYEDDGTGLSGSVLLTMINPDLDARLPVMLAIESPIDGGHCVLCDGYGYSTATLFYHVNAGWGGDDDVWYALPDIDTADNGDFTMVTAAIYNIYTNGSGQIISGRVTDPTGAAVAGASVKAAGTGGPFTATTDTNGIYALARITANTSYTLTVTNAGYNTNTGNYSTGASVYNVLPSGNVWGANFVLSPPLLAMPETGFASIGPTNGPFSVASTNYTLTNTSAASINWQLSNTNTWLEVSSSNGTVTAGAAASLTVSLTPAANSLAAGTYSGSIWITNLNNGLAQQLTFSLSVETADYPIAVTGYNLDVVVESNATGGNTTNYAATFDPSCSVFGSFNPVCFYEAGLVATNQYGGAADLGLPSGGFFTSASDGATTFQLGPYDGSNVLYLTSGAPSNSLTLNTPASYNSLSILAASIDGGGSATLVLHFANGTTSSNIDFNAPNYLETASGAGAAIANFGLLITGNYNEYYSDDAEIDGGAFPTLYQTSINLKSQGLETNTIDSVTFIMPTNGGGFTTSSTMGIFALSGTVSGAYSVNVSASPANGGTVSGGGTFPSNSTVTVTATAANGYMFANWTTNGGVASTLSDYPFVLSNDVTLVANFVTTPSHIGIFDGTAALTNNQTNAVIFTTTELNQTGSSITFTVTNTGGQPLVLTNITVPPGFVLNTNPPSTITNFPSAIVGVTNGTPTNATFNVQLVTTAPGTNSGNIVITNNDPANNPFTFAVTGTVAASATISVTASPAGSGTVSGGGTFAQGNLQTVTATANGGYLFTNWTTNGGVASTSNNYTFTVISNETLVANFVPISTLIQAPGSLAGNTVLIDVAGGTSPFASYGYYLFVPANTGNNYQVIGIYNVLDSIGTYSYTNAEALGMINFSDSVAGSLAGALNFSTATSGGFHVTNAALSASQSGNFNMFFGQVLDSVAGESVECTIQGGIYPFATSGTATFKAAASGNKFVVVGDGVNTAGSSGTYSYSKLNATTGVLQIDDSKAGVVNTYISFYSLSTGVFATTSPSTGAYQIGSFYIADPGSLPASLNVVTNGTGTVSPNLNGKVLRTGKSYSLTAVAGKGDVFSNWSGGITSTKNPLTFILQSNTVLQANFVPNPFMPFVGTYNGLFTASNGIVSEATAGMLKGLTLTSKGTYSGALLINGASKSISGSFDAALNASNSVKIDGGTLVMGMILVSNGPTPQVTGTVSGSGWVATNLMADRATNPPLSSAYTLLIQPDANADSSPPGSGYATISVSPGTARTPATVKITGALADGTAFSQSVPVSLDGYVPIYANLYSGKGLLLGWVNLTNASGAALAWFHPVRTGSFTSEFTSTNQTLLSPWASSPLIGLLPAELVVVEAAGDIPTSTNDYLLSISGTYAFGKAPNSTPYGSIAPKTGLVKVTFGSGAAKTTGYGVVLLDGTDGTNGGGYFLTKTNAGAIILKP